MTDDWRKTSLTWGKRVTLTVLIIGALCYGVLSLAERYNEPLRSGLEQYLSQSSGQKAEITELSEAKIIPDTIFNMKGIYIRDRNDSSKLYLHAKTAYLAMPFWRLLLSMSTYAAMEVKGLEVASGFFLPKKLIVDFGGISDPTPETAPAIFMVEGQYNNLPLLLTMDMKRTPTKRGPLYSFQGNAPVTFKLGKLEGDGIFVRNFSNVMLDEVHLVRGEREAKFIVKNLDAKPLNALIRGQIDGVDFNGQLTKSGQTNLLTITPETSDREGLLKIKNFVDGMKSDFGLSGKDNALVISISGQDASEPTAKEEMKTDYKPDTAKPSAKESKTK